jgi:large subunit ribosomal protein L23
MADGILKKNCYTEKFTALMARGNQYVFDVAISGTKNRIAEAVEAAFGVTVLAVNVTPRDGTIRPNRMRCGHFGRTAQRKIAIVTLKDGDKIEII